MTSDDKVVKKGLLRNVFDDSSVSINSADENDNTPQQIQKRQRSANGKKGDPSPIIKKQRGEVGRSLKSEDVKTVNGDGSGSGGLGRSRSLCKVSPGGKPGFKNIFNKFQIEESSDEEERNSFSFSNSSSSTAGKTFGDTSSGNKTPKKSLMFCQDDSDEKKNNKKSSEL